MEGVPYFANAAERDYRFGHDGLRQRNARDREAGRINGMRVDDGLHVRSLFVYAHVHLDFAGRFEPGIRLDHLSVFVYFTDIFGGHESLADAGRRAEKFVIVQFDGNIAVVRRDHPLVVNSLPDFANLLFNLKFVYHNDLLTSLLFYSYIIS